MSGALRRGERGQSLMFVLVLMASFGILSLGLLGLVSTASLLNQRVNTPLQERLAADAGVEYGIDQVVEGGAAADFAASQTVLVPGAVKGDVVNVTVANVTVTSVTISPSAATIAAGGSAVFTATALNGAVVMDGQQGRPGFAPVWTLSCPSTITASISAGGIVTVTARTASGTCTVQIQVNNVSATATVTVP